MKNPLHKRYLRELKQDAGKYLVLFLFLTLTIGFVSGFQVADSSMTKAYDESFEKYKIEDGHFTLAVKADKELKSKLKKEHLKLSEIFYKDVERKNEHSVRIYTQNDDVNKICVMDGKFPKNKDEIIIDRLYAENNGIAIGDKFDVDGKKFTVSGVAAFSNYSALFKNNTDMMFDANKFTVAMVTKKGFERFSDDELHYCYAYRWNHRGYSEQKVSDKSDDVKDILKKTGLLTDFVKASDNQAITFTGEDMGGDLVMIITLLYIVMVVLAFVFAVTTRSTIEKEASTIGTLRALGYTRGGTDPALSDSADLGYTDLRSYRKHFRIYLYERCGRRYLLSQLFTSDLRDDLEYGSLLADDRSSMPDRICDRAVDLSFHDASATVAVFTSRAAEKEKERRDTSAGV